MTCVSSRGVRQLTRYLNIVRPVVTAIFSAKVSSVAMSDFVHPYGFPNAEHALLQSISVPQIKSFIGSAKLELDNEHQEGYLTIVVPHLHPDVDRYGEVPIELRSVIYLTLLVTIYLATEALALARQTPQARHDDLVRQLFETRGTDAPDLLEAASDLYRRLERAKTNLREYWMRRARQEAPVPLAARQGSSEARALGQLERIAITGMATGRPHSVERR